MGVHPAPPTHARLPRALVRPLFLSPLYRRENHRGRGTHLCSHGLYVAVPRLSTAWHGQDSSVLTAGPGWSLINENLT